MSSTAEQTIHQGTAVVTAVETTDACLGRVVEAVTARGRVFPSSSRER